MRVLTTPSGRKRVTGRVAMWAACGAAVACAFAAAPAQAAAGPKYFFQLREVKASPAVDAALKDFAGATLKSELASRPEWASDISAPDPAALSAELARRKLRGFNVTVRLEDPHQEVKPPKPGGRLKQLEVSVRVNVFGTTVVEEKLAFSGDGEAGLAAEVSDKRIDAETVSLTKDAIKDAIKQAVDQAVLKLSIAPGSSPKLRHAKRSK